MTNLSALSDEELIRRIRSSAKNENGAETEAMKEWLLTKYKPLVRKVANTESFRISGGDYDDLLQEGMIGLVKAINHYAGDRGAAFSTFATLCVRRQMISAVEASNRDKNAALNSYIPLNGGSFEDGNLEETRLIDSARELATKSAEELVTDMDTVRELNRQIHEKLSPLENQVYDLYVAGMDYAEIGKRLKKDKKAVDNAVQRIKHKIRPLLDG
ncbi:MAG: sigma-70 family RNA polymerase sigma factor [Lachnospiraceae bacterium]|nr:sigma-70 family RNA polymerase sigma factor [Lachnospiraceae bacterium]